MARLFPSQEFRRVAAFYRSCHQPDRMTRDSIYEAHHFDSRILRKGVLTAELQSVTAISSDRAISIQDCGCLFRENYLARLQIHVRLRISRAARYQARRQLGLAGGIHS